METTQHYGRFFAMFNKLPYVGDREELRRTLVGQYTQGRTDSLREMRPAEYAALCQGMERMLNDREQLRRRRSLCLHLMQKLGIDTSDWARVNDFCRNARIAGKEFRRLDLAGLSALEKKLRAIGRNGGLRRKAAEPETPAAQPKRQVHVMIMPYVGEA